MEQVILVHDMGGDIIAAVRPVDALNPEFTIEEIEAMKDLSTELVTVSGLVDFLESRAGMYQDGGYVPVRS
jgi:hypothetical protein